MGRVDKQKFKVRLWRDEQRGQLKASKHNLIEERPGAQD